MDLEDRLWRGLGLFVLVLQLGMAERAADGADGWCWCWYEKYLRALVWKTAGASGLALRWFGVVLQDSWCWFWC